MATAVGTAPESPPGAKCKGAWPPEQAPFSRQTPPTGFRFFLERRHAPSLPIAKDTCSRLFRRAPVHFCAACLSRQSGATPPVEQGAVRKWTRAPLSVSVLRRGGSVAGKAAPFSRSVA